MSCSIRTGSGGGGVGLGQHRLGFVQGDAAVGHAVGQDQAGGAHHVRMVGEQPRQARQGPGGGQKVIIEKHDHVAAVGDRLDPAIALRAQAPRTQDDIDVLRHVGGQVRARFSRDHHRRRGQGLAAQTGQQVLAFRRAPQGRHDHPRREDRRRRAPPRRPRKAERFADPSPSRSAKLASTSRARARPMVRPPRARPQAKPSRRGLGFAAIRTHGAHPWPHAAHWGAAGLGLEAALAALSRAVRRSRPRAKPLRAQGSARV